MRKTSYMQNMDINLSPMNFLLHHQCRVILKACVGFGQSFFPNIFSLLLYVDNKENRF